MDSWLEALAQRAAQQHGVITMHDAVGLGATASRARNELSRPEWERVGRSVWRVAGSPNTVEQRLMIALLSAGAGAVLSNETAAARYGVPGFEAERPIHVVRGRSNSTTPPGVRVHRVRRMWTDEVTVLDGFPIVRPFRIPFELADAGMAEGRVARLTDRLWADRLLTGAQLHRHFDERFNAGHPGRSTMKRILAARGTDWVPPASGLENRKLTTLERYELFGFERQVDLGDDLRWIGRVDFFHRSLKVVIEVQSDRHHLALSDVVADTARRQALEAAGFEVVEVWESEIWYKPEIWTGRVRAAIARARRRNAA